MEVLVTLAIAVVLLGLAALVLRGANRRAHTEGAARVVTSFLRSAQATAATRGMPVAVGLPTEGAVAAQGLYLLEGDGRSRVTRVLNLSGDFPGVCLFALPETDEPAPDLELGVDAPPSVPAWAPDHAGDVLLVFSPSGQVGAHGTGLADGRYHLLVSAGLEGEVSAVSEPFTVAVTPLGAVTMEAGAAPVFGSPRESERLELPACGTLPSLARRSEVAPVLQSLEILPDPDDLDLPEGIDAAVDPDGFLTLEMRATSPEGAALFCRWFDSDGGRLSSPGEERMQPTDDGQWVSRWHWRPPDTPAASYVVRCRVEDEFGNPADDTSVNTVLTFQVSNETQRLVFGSDRFPDTSLFSIFKDGVGERRLTEPPPGINDEVGGWSPDGARAVLYSTREGGELFVVNADGSDLRRLTFDPLAEGSPEWTPSGTAIVFNRHLANGNRDVWIINADGSNPRNLTNTPSKNEQLCTWRGTGYLQSAVSPDDSKVVYQVGNSLEIVAVAAPGVPSTVSTGLARADDPAWSPDGSQLVMVGQVTIPGPSEVYLCPADLSAPPTALTSGAAALSSPTFSPDGQKIAYVSSRNGNDLYVYDLLTGTERAVASSPFKEGLPRWMDSETLSFVTDRDGNQEVYTVHLGDGKTVNVTHHDGQEFFYGWSP